jgi:hypothetical protein
MFSNGNVLLINSRRHWPQVRNRGNQTSNKWRETMIFQKNDYVKCIDAVGYGHRLTAGTIYQVADIKVRGKMITVDGDDGTPVGCFSARFELFEMPANGIIPPLPPVASTVEAPVNTSVKNPSHYDFFPGVEAIQIIRASLTADQWKGYCMGNKLKYRLRAGSKDNLQQDIDKSNFYEDLYNKYL